MQLWARDSVGCCQGLTTGFISTRVLQISENIDYETIIKTEMHRHVKLDTTVNLFFF